MARGRESAVLREYRHLLRTAPTDWQEAAHRHALTTLGPAVRAHALAEVQRLLLTGTRLRPDDVHAIARLLVLAERRHPRVLLDAMHPVLLARLASAVVASPTGRALAVGIDVWDGRDPRPAVPDGPPPHHVAWSGEWGTRFASDDLGSVWVATAPRRR